MKKEYLGNVCEFYSGTGFPTKYQGINKGKYPFYKVGDISRNIAAGNYMLKASENYIDEKILSEIKGKIVPPNTVVFAKIGEALRLNRRAITTQECLVDNNIIGIRPRKDYLSLNYFYYYMQSLDMQLYSEVTTVPSVKKSTLESIRITLPDFEVQNKIAAKLDTVTRLINNRERTLIYFDKLVKSRFIEMFGDPVNNPTYITTKSMTDICQIIDGDRGKNYPKAEDLQSSGYCLFLNAKNVTSTGFRFDECMFITKEKDEVMRKGKLQRGDIILTTRGTIGNLAIYVDDVPYDNMRINSGMVILRLNENEVNDVFFVKQFRMQLDNIIGRVVSGSAQPQLPISTMMVLCQDLKQIKMRIFQRKTNFCFLGCICAFM